MTFCDRDAGDGPGEVIPGWMLDRRGWGRVVSPFSCPGSSYDHHWGLIDLVQLVRNMSSAGFSLPGTNRVRYNG
jgi:hypothetical protein